ncbi:hypothetical protein BDV93DRAFT_528386 [Ceratobasidium sp. AG-I]|nr:hypothetical protein BDV93DRAFT_528386 [Ceratobasidium sp. AG-I]
MVYRAAFNIPNTKYDTYFFKFDQYVRVNWTPGVGGGDSIVYGPAKFTDDSPALKKAGFDHVDAILPIPGHERRAYFFSGNRYAHVNFYPDDHTQDRLYNTSPVSNWASLKQAGFDFVDGALIVPGTTNEAFFFSEDQYCRVSFNEGQANDKLLEGPKSISSGWSAMGYPAVDTIIPRPGLPADRAYIFYGKNYIQTQVTGEGEGELTSSPRDVASWWKESLGKAGFY